MIKAVYLQKYVTLSKKCMKDNSEANFKEIEDFNQEFNLNFGERFDSEPDMKQVSEDLGNLVKLLKKNVGFVSKSKNKKKKKKVLY